MNVNKDGLLRFAVLGARSVYGRFFVLQAGGTRSPALCVATPALWTKIGVSATRFLVALGIVNKPMLSQYCPT